MALAAKVISDTLEKLRIQKEIDFDPKGREYSLVELSEHKSGIHGYVTLGCVGQSLWIGRFHGKNFQYGIKGVRRFLLYLCNTMRLKSFIFGCNDPKGDRIARVWKMSKVEDSSLWDGGHWEYKI